MCNTCLCEITGCVGVIYFKVHRKTNWFYNKSGQQLPSILLNANRSRVLCPSGPPDVKLYPQKNLDHTHASGFLHLIHNSRMVTSAMVGKY